MPTSVSRRPRTRPDAVRMLLGTNALLLGAMVWMQVADRPLAATPAVAGAAATEPPRFPNASDQRRAIEKAVLELKKSVDKLSSDIARGGLRVEVTNAGDIAAAMRDTDPDGGG